MNNIISFNANIIFEKIKTIDNTYDLLTEIFSDNICSVNEPNFKYFIITLFLQKKNIQLSFQEIWKLFKVLISINPNIIKDESETNELYAVCVKNCVKMLLKGLNNLNFEINFGFKNNEVSVMFDYLFSLPLVKHYINSIESIRQKEEIYELLNQIGKLIFDKIKLGKNNVIKNIFNDFYHFLNIDDIINKNNKNNEDKKLVNSFQPQIKNLNIFKNNLDNIENNFSNVSNNENINTMNKINLSNKCVNNDYSNNIYSNTLTNSLIFSQSVSNFAEKQNSIIKFQKEKSEEEKPKNKKTTDVTKNNNNINNIPNSIPLINKSNVNEEIKIFKKYIKDLVEKVNSFINFEEMKHSIKEKLPGNCLLQIGSYLYTTPYPDLTNINIDLLIQKQNNGSYNIKKYFDTFETFKNISNIKCSFFCLNKDQYFYDCLEKNKSFFHLTRTDMDESTIQSVYNFKTVTVHLYAYNMIYGYSSFFFKKLYSTVKNLWKLHLFYETILLKHFPLLKSNYELSLLILNFLQINYKVFSEKIEDKKFTYFAYDRSKKYGYLTNYPLVMQYKTLYFFEYDEARISFIKQIPVLELAKEFHHFLCKYFEYIYNDGQSFDYKNELNISRDNYFLDIKYIFNRHFLDQNLIYYKNNSTDEFIKIKNLFSTLCLE